MSDIERTATLSDDGTYRYDLTRRWGDGPRPCSVALFIMLNPSTADADVDDPTIRRCMGFAKRERCDGLAVVNLYALRATDPDYLLVHGSPQGPDNKATIERWLTSDDVFVVVAAWGAWWSSENRIKSGSGLARLNIEGMAHDAGRALFALGTTKHGDPRHPLYVRRDQPLEQFGARS